MGCNLAYCSLDTYPEKYQGQTVHLKKYYSRTDYEHEKIFLKLSAAQLLLQPITCIYVHYLSEGSSLRKQLIFIAAKRFFLSSGLK